MDLFKRKKVRPTGALDFTVRKQVYELTAGDLESAPVWEFALDEEGLPGQDEATVRPVDRQPPIDPADGMCVVACDFNFADGTVLSGYFTPQFPDMASLGYVQPTVIIQEGEQIGFWLGGWSQDPQELVTRRYAMLGRGPEIFPVTYLSRTEVVGPTGSGTIEGFYYTTEFEGEPKLIR